MKCETCDLELNINSLVVSYYKSKAEDKWSYEEEKLILSTLNLKPREVAKLLPTRSNQAIRLKRLRLQEEGITLEKLEQLKEKEMYCPNCLEVLDKNKILYEYKRVTALRNKRGALIKLKNKLKWR